jgi:hypothetical protein
MQKTYPNSCGSQEKNHLHGNLLPLNRKGFGVRETKLSLPGMEALHKSLHPCHGISTGWQVRVRG